MALKSDDLTYLIYDTMLKYINHSVEQTSRRITINYEDESGQFDGRLDIEFNEDTCEIEHMSTSYNRKQHLVDAYKEKMASENRRIGENNER